MSPLADMDSDCVADESDNCPLLYNPDQGDGDADGAGYACDQDDQDDAVGPTQEMIVDDVTPSENQEREDESDLDESSSSEKE